MISIFDDEGNRLSVAWNGIEFNAPVLTRYAGSTGKRLEFAGFSTPVNFHSEAIDDIVKGGGGIEFYNPRVGTRILNLRGSIRDETESGLMEQIVLMQRAFHPLLLQVNYALDRLDALQWPVPEGMPDWVRSKPLTFTRCMPKSTAPSLYPDGKFPLQYHVVPIALPDPIKASVLQGVGVDYEAQFLIMDGGRSFSQTATDVQGDTTIPMVWGQAPVWPTISFSVTAAGNANLTITTTTAAGAMDNVLVLNASLLSISDAVVVETDTRTIYVDGVRTSSLYVSGDYPSLPGGVSTSSIAWTNIENVTASSNKITYRESDYV